jgi:hypothetical protein
VVALFVSAAAHADPVRMDFTLTRIQSFDDLNKPSTFTYLKGGFSLAQNQSPDFVGILDANTPNPTFQEMQYFNTPFTMVTIEDGAVLSESRGMGTVTFWWDGIALPNGFHVYNSPLPFDVNNPYHPEFVAGHYVNGTDPLTWYDVVEETPEPSTLMLLGTGLAGSAGVLRRRRLYA